jgi:hypothetical protein
MTRPNARLALPASLLGGAAFLLLAGILAGGGAPPALAQARPGTFCTDPYSFPTGFDYQQSSETVEGWVERRDDVRAREHGWYLFAGVNQQIDGQPIWRSWCTSTQAFAADPGTAKTGTVRVPATTLSLKQRRLARGLTTPASAAAPPPNGEDPIQLPDAPVYPVPKIVYSNPAYVAAKCSDGTNGLDSQGTSVTHGLTSGPTLLDEGNVTVVGVIYNDPAYDWIRRDRLYQGSVLDRLQAAGRKEMPPMPSSSMVLKPMLWPVQQGDSYTAVPVWDDLPPEADKGSYAGFEVKRLWSRAVAVTARPGRQKSARVSYLHGVLDSYGEGMAEITYDDAAVVGVDQFYNYQPDLGTMAVCDRALLDQSAYYAYGREFRQGDYLVLVAMHVMSKEQPDWTFQSFWWHDKPGYGPYAADRPKIPGAAGPWDHYLMASTYGMAERPGGGSWPIAYNPYIELAADHPIRTNCMNCHHRAGWPKLQAHYEVAGQQPDALRIFDGNNPIFDGLMRTDAMWTVPDAALPAPTAPAARRRR